MSRLEEIREELYRAKARDRSRRPEPVRPLQTPPAVPPAWGEAPGDNSQLITRSYLAAWRGRRTRTRTVVAGALVVITALGAYIGYTILFASSTVEFELLGPSQIVAGDPTTITIRIVNRGTVALRDGSFTLALPVGASFLSPVDTSLDQLGPSQERSALSAGPRPRMVVSDLARGETFQREFLVAFLGPAGKSQRVSGIYTYRPENITSRLTRQSAFEAMIARVPVAVTISAFPEVPSGQEVSITIGVDTETRASLPNLSLGVEFPLGFTLRSADPAPVATGVPRWALGQLASGTSTLITLRGTLTGDPGEAKPFVVRLGRYDAKSASWLILTETSGGPVIASPLLLVRASLDGNRSGVIEAGAQVAGEVFFKNNLAQRVESVTITLAMPERLIDASSLRAEGGFYDATKRLLTWNPASNSRLRELSPGEEGVLGFAFTLRSALPIRTFTDKHFTLPIITTISSGIPPPDHRSELLEYRETIEFKVTSRLSLSARAVYYDSPVKNSGPLPPAVRKTTSYTVYMQFGSGASDLRDVSVRAELAGGVEFRGAISSDAGTIDFNPANRELAWRIGPVAAATGVLRPHLLATFQVALTPADNQVGSSPVLLQGISASGRDAFTGMEPSVVADNLTTELRVDTRSKPEEWRVAP